MFKANRELQKLSTQSILLIIANRKLPVQSSFGSCACSYSLNWKVAVCVGVYNTKTCTITETNITVGHRTKSEQKHQMSDHK